MQKRRLGRTNLQVSVVGFGGVPIVKVDQKEAKKVIRHAFNLGINYFDAARDWGDSEEKIGAALSGSRDKCILCTKIRPHLNRDAAHIKLTQSLRNLKTDRIDVVELHTVDKEGLLKKAFRPDGCLAALKEARSQGKIDFIGISGHNSHLLIKAIKTGEFDVVLVPLNFLDRRSTEELIPIAGKLDVGVTIMKAFGGPSFDWAQRAEVFRAEPTALNEWLGEFASIFGRDGISRARRSLRFVLAHDIAAVVPGLSSVEEVEAAVKVGEEFNGLTPKEREAYRFGERPPEPFCRECGFCSCPFGLKISTMLRFDEYFTYHGIKKWTRELYQRLPTKVDSCTNCGECEPKCPYKLPIVSMLQRAEKRLRKSLAMPEIKEPNHITVDGS